jgi:hypothetical protein
LSKLALIQNKAIPLSEQQEELRNFILLVVDQSPFFVSKAN